MTRYQIKFPIKYKPGGQRWQTMQLTGDTIDPRMILEAYIQLEFSGDDTPNIFRNDIEITLEQLDEDLKKYDK